MVTFHRMDMRSSMLLRIPEVRVVAPQMNPVRCIATRTALKAAAASCCAGAGAGAAAKMLPVRSANAHDLVQCT